MNFILCFAFVTCFCLLGVNCRSLQVDSDSNSGLEGKDLNHDQENGGIFSWIRLKPILRREVQRIKNLKDMEANKLNQKIVESSSTYSKEDEKVVNREFDKSTLSSNLEEAENLYNSKSTEFTYSISSNLSNLESAESTFSTHPEEEENLINSDSTGSFSTQSKEVEENLINLESTEFAFSTHSKEEEEENLIKLESTESTYSTHSREEENLFNQDSTKTFSSSSEEGNLYDEDISVDRNSSQIVNMNSIKLELADTNQNEEHNSETDIPELESNITHIEKLKSDSNLMTYDILDNTISDILNASGDSIIFQILSDNSSAIESLDFDETTLLSEGGPIATFQEVSTIGFELLIDSETKQNLILAELLSSQSTLAGDDFTVEDFSTVDFDSIEISGSDLQEIETGEETREENTTSNLATAELTTNEVVNRSTDRSSIQDGSLLEISSTGPGKEPECPDSGWCLFWFLTEDMCAKDAHCPGSMKCCIWGCSKMCVDVDSELF